jgi:hypothetical protein
MAMRATQTIANMWTDDSRILRFPPPPSPNHDDYDQMDDGYRLARPDVPRGHVAEIGVAIFEAGKLWIDRRDGGPSTAEFPQSPRHDHDNREDRLDGNGFATIHKVRDGTADLTITTSEAGDLGRGGPDETVARTAYTERTTTRRMDSSSTAFNRHRCIHPGAAMLVSSIARVAVEMFRLASSPPRTCQRHEKNTTPPRL